ncbi:MAG: methionine--tRNA ligase [Pedosphaera sp.]|nr:methionine--tRNA ligase [Pedosphaera sp.]
MQKKFYITTAIYYVNGAPHLGHAYEKIITDIIARARRSLGQSVFFLTGLDEHGQKVQQAASEKGISPQAYCDEMAIQWQTFVARLNISNDDYVRTTQPRHKEVVKALLTKLHDQGDIYQAPYRGWYSARHETFLTDKDLRPDGTWDPAYGEVTELVEENWYFKMGQHQEWLVQYLESHPEFVQPDYRRNEVLGFLRAETLEDLCISRPSSRLSWGIPIPFAPDYVNYVWFDALVNYLSVPASMGDPATALVTGATATGASIWPPDLHVIGKDILKFHAVYWPIMLQAAGLPLPRQVLAHGFWQKDGQKMSKSTGNVVDPIAIIDEWGVDAFRYYVVRELDIGPDGNWTDEGFRQRYAAELANGLGNLVNRSLSMLRKYRAGRIGMVSQELADDAAEAVRGVEVCLRENRLQAGLAAVWTLVNRANLYVEQTKPFSLAKDPTQAKRLDEVLYNLAESCRVLAVVLWPFIPDTAQRIYAQLQVCGEPSQWRNSAWGGLEVGHETGEPIPLFPRKDLPPKA